jgi:hypothetical protein
MKYTILVLLCLLTCNTVFGQWPNPENARLTNTITNFMNQFAGGGLPVPVQVPVDYNQYSDYQNGYQQYLQNDLTQTEIFFQKRQTNSYYTQLEKLQKQEILELKKSKQLTISELNRIFNKEPRY